MRAYCSRACACVAWRPARAKLARARRSPRKKIAARSGRRARTPHAHARDGAQHKAAPRNNAANSERRDDSRAASLGGWRHTHTRHTRHLLALLRLAPCTLAHLPRRLLIALRSPSRASDWLQLDLGARLLAHWRRRTPGKLPPIPVVRGERSPLFAHPPATARHERFAHDVRFMPVAARRHRTRAAPPARALRFGPSLAARKKRGRPTPPCAVCRQGVRDHATRRVAAGPPRWGFSVCAPLRSGVGGRQAHTTRAAMLRRPPPSLRLPPGECASASHHAACLEPHRQSHPPPWCVDHPALTRRRRRRRRSLSRAQRRTTTTPNNDVVRARSMQQQQRLGLQSRRALAESLAAA